MLLDSTWYPAGADIHLESDNPDIAAALFVSLAGSRLYGWSRQIETTIIMAPDPDKIRDILKVWLYRNGKSVDEEFGAFSAIPPNADVPQNLIITGLDAYIPANCLVLALGSVSRGDFTGTMVSTAKTEGCLYTWRLGPPNGVGRCVLSNLHGSPIIPLLAKPRQAPDVVGEPIETLYVTGTRGGPDEIEPSDLYRKVFAHRLVALSKFSFDNTRDKRTYDLKMLIRPHEGQPWPILSAVNDLMALNPAAANRLDRTISSMNAIHKLIRRHDMYNVWTGLGNGVRVRIEQGKHGRGSRTKVHVERQRAPRSV